jgi:hypothetical protein
VNGLSRQGKLYLVGAFVTPGTSYSFSLLVSRNIQDEEYILMSPSLGAVSWEPDTDPSSQPDNHVIVADSTSAVDDVDDACEAAETDSEYV